MKKNSSEKNSNSYDRVQNLIPPLRKVISLFFNPLIIRREPSHPDIFYKTEGDEIGKQGRAPVAHERQGYPDDRHEAKGHPDIDEEIECKHIGDAERKELSLTVPRLLCGVKAPPDNEQIHGK